jgi:K+-transporting ATPase KdpF subunit
VHKGRVCFGSTSPQCPGHQERVKTPQWLINRPPGTSQGWCGGGMYEDLIAVVLGFGLLAYLLYALARPDQF